MITIKYFLIILFLIIIFQKNKEEFNIIYTYDDVLKNKTATPFPIDIVYTWSGESKSNDIRTRNNDELKYSIKSIIKYAPWLNRIFILMNPPKKKPSWFNDDYTKIITLVDQSETFPDNYKLPNKNSCAIETTLHNIKGLSEHFIYFNDDLFLGKMSNYTDFFTKDGKALISDTILDKKSMMINNNNILKLKYPHTAGFYPHLPYPIIKSQYEKYIKEYKGYVNWIRSFDTRNGDGCDICYLNELECPCQEFHHPFGIYMYENNKAVLKKIKTKNGDFYNPLDGYINSYNLDYLDKFIDDSPLFICINDDGLNDKFYENNRKKILNFFEKKYNFKIFFEI